MSADHSNTASTRAKAIADAINKAVAEFEPGEQTPEESRAFVLAFAEGYDAGWNARAEEVKALEMALATMGVDYGAEIKRLENHITKLEVEFIDLGAENKRLVEKYDLQLLVQREKRLREALELIAGNARYQEGEHGYQFVIIAKDALGFLKAGVR